VRDGHLTVRWWNHHNKKGVAGDSRKGEKPLALVRGFGKPEILPFPWVKAANHRYTQQDNRPIVGGRDPGVGETGTGGCESVGIPSGGSENIREFITEWCPKGFGAR
jgi:hypothetical protein